MRAGRLVRAIEDRGARIVATLMLGVLSVIAFDSVVAASDAPAVFSDGTYSVGVDIAPGTYVAELDDGVCHVAITDIEDETRNPSFLGRAIISITEDDATVETSGCGEWYARYDSAPKSLPSHFGQGMNQVGIDMVPGVYTADSNSGRCLWFVVSDFEHHTNAEQLLTWWKVGQPVVKLTSDDVGFYSIRCGNWQRRETGSDQEPASQFSDGSYLVNIDITTGTYVSDSNDNYCNWFRTAPFGDSIADNTGGYASTGRQIIEILDSDTGFYSEGCGTWQPFSTLDTGFAPSGTIGQGTHAVGVDIQPGAYTAESKDAGMCRWYLLSGFAGRPSDIAGYGTGVARGIVEVPQDAVGFRSLNCGEWTRIEDLTKNEILNGRIPEGEHIVNIHLSPGIYTSPGPETGRCSWRRLVGYSGSSAEHVAVRNPVGKNIAEIMDTDTVFVSFGCGEWRPLESSSGTGVLRSFEKGTWAVNREIAPGTYSADVPDGSTCFWSRLSSFSGEPNAFAATESTIGHSVATIRDFDAGFYSDGCGVWFEVSDELTTSEDEPASVFDDGVYLVNRDVAAGTYIASGIEGEACYWSRVTGFDGDDFNQLTLYASRGQAIATILSSDAGFRSFGCGTWQQIQQTDESIHPNDDTETKRFSDGTYRVGIDITPGTYMTAAPTGPTCRWRRLSDFTWTSGVIVESIAAGRKIVDIDDDDTGFASSGCGEWISVDIDSLAPSENTLPPTRFGSGSYLVGVHIEPGTYYAMPRRSGACKWSRVNRFGGVSSDQISSGKATNRWVVTIDTNDIGFVTYDCGVWRNIDIALKLGPYETFSDGTYRVNEDILPGNYVANIPTQPFIGGKPTPICTWQRVSGFGHTDDNVIEHGRGKGKIVVTISENDAGFVSNGCGEWQRAD